MAFAQTMSANRVAAFSSSRVASSKSIAPIAAPLRAFNPLRITSPSRTGVVTFAKASFKGPKVNPKYDESAFKLDSPESAFTRRRELFIGRLAMTGFFAAVVGEILTGKGAIGQLSLETSLPPAVLNVLIGGIVVVNFITALNPNGPTFSKENQEDVAKRPKGAVQDPNINVATNPKKFLGITNFGFTKANEIFVGRWAMIGFAASLVGEKFQGGKGPLGQLGFQMPLYGEYAAFGLAAWVLFFLAAAVGFSNFGEQETGQDEY